MSVFLMPSRALCVARSALRVLLLELCPLSFLMSELVCFMGVVLMYLTAADGSQSNLSLYTLF